MDDMIKIVTSPGVSGILINIVNETIKNEAKEQKCEFLGMFSSKAGKEMKGKIHAEE